jgi:hypothetical protein
MGLLTTARQLLLRQGKARRLGREAPLIRVPCTKALKSTLDAAYRRAAVILTTKTGRSYSKRYLAQQWEKTCKAAGIVDLHFHDIRGTTVTMLAEAGCTLPEIVSITGHTLRRAQDILDKYLARTSKLAESEIAKFENVIANRFCKTDCKMTTSNQGYVLARPEGLEPPGSLPHRQLGVCCASRQKRISDVRLGSF